jgi:hypothetical protein
MLNEHSSLSCSLSPFSTGCSPCAHHVLTICSPCAHLVLIMCSPCAHNVLIMCSPCAHHVFTMCSPCAHLVLTLCSPCAHLVLTVCSPSIIISGSSPWVEFFKPFGRQTLLTHLALPRRRAIVVIASAHKHGRSRVRIPQGSKVFRSI